MTHASEFKIPDGGVTFVKILAVLLMLADHINTYVYAESNALVFAAGRLAMPLFSFVLAYNLARTETDSRVFYRVLRRLAFWGGISSIPYLSLGHVIWGWYPLNILYMFFVSVLCCICMCSKSKIAQCLSIVVFVLGGYIVEFWWPGIALFLSAWFFCRKPSYLLAATWVLISTAGLWFVNGNCWAVAAGGVIWGASKITMELPRVKWFFYLFYPIHLGAIWLYLHR